jgi:hypothetical protein
MDLRKEKGHKAKHNFIMKRFIIYTFHQILLGRTRWVRHVACMQEIKIEYRIVIGELAGRRRLVRLIHRHRIRSKDVPCEHIN